MEFLIHGNIWIKLKIDFHEREKTLRLLEKHRGKHGEFDCIVPQW